MDVDDDETNNKVALMTAHSAKGLEFPVVFLVGMEEGLLPHVRATDESPEDVEEERRLTYVGMTRAMRELYMSFAQSRFMYGGRSYNFPSRFLTDLGFNPYGAHDRDGDGFLDDDDDFGEDDFSDEGWDTEDPFPPDLPVFY